MLNRKQLLSDIQNALETSPEPHRAVTRLIREAGLFRWVGLYVVDQEQGIVRNIVWEGPAAPEFPTFPIEKGLTASAIAQRKTVNVGDVDHDPRYLTALGSSKSEMIVPILDEAGDAVIGTIDVESDEPNAFDAEVQSVLEACAAILKPLWAKT